VLAALAVAGLGLVLAWLGGAFRDVVHPGEVPVERVGSTGRTLVPVERLRAEDTTVVIGSVQPKRKADVASQVLATVLDVRVRPGDRVKPGEVLVLLDDRELLAQQRETTAALVAAEADLVTRRSDYDRLKKLRDSGSVSADEFSRVEGAFRIADAQVNRAKEMLARLTVQLTHTKVVSAAGGLVADRLVDPDDLATPGKTLLVMYDPNDLEFHAHVPESLVSALAVGQPLAVRVDAAGLSVTGTIREVIPQAQQASRSVLVKVTLPPTTSAKPLLPGMFGRVAITVGTVDRLWVAKAAVVQVGQLDVVEAVNPDGTLARRFIRTGQESDGKVEVLSGLVPGERIALPVR
jgi:RND family efflux transporter MFP subunit